MICIGIRGPLELFSRTAEQSLGITELERETYKEKHKEIEMSMQNIKLHNIRTGVLTFPSSNLSLSSVMIRTLGGTRNTPTVDGPSFRSFDKIRKTKIQIFKIHQ